MQIKLIISAINGIDKRKEDRMKNKKWNRWLCAAFVSTCVLVSMTACGKKEETKTETKAVVVETKSKETEAQEELEMHGVIKEYTGGKMTITTEDNKELSFTLTNATIECKNGIVSGDEVTIIYTGAINGTDTSKAVVMRIVDKGEKAELKEQNVSGTVAAVAMNTLTIKDNDGRTLSFMTTGAEAHYKNGIQAGNWVTIVYKGEIQGDNAQNVKVISITDDAPNVEEAKNQVTINDADKTVYATTTVHVRDNYSTDANSLGLLNTGDGVHETGESSNGWARVDYNGQTGYVYETYLTTDAPQPETQAPETQAPETQAPEPQPQPETQPAPDEPVANPDTFGGEELQMTGILKEATMHIITITSDEDGQDYTFNISDAEVHLSDGLAVGQSLVIKYQGTASSDATTCSVLNVDGSAMNENNEAPLTMTGRVIATSMNCVTIGTSDGAEVSFDIEDAQINCADGLQTDDNVTISYTENGDSNIHYALSVDDAQ